MTAFQTDLKDPKSRAPESFGKNLACSIASLNVFYKYYLKGGGLIFAEIKLLVYELFSNLLINLKDDSKQYQHDQIMLR